jgi:hypothetical protein
LDDDDNDNDDNDNDVNADTNKLNQNKIKRLKDILYFKTKKRSQRLTQLLMFNLKAILVIKSQSLDIGNLTDTKIRDDILNNKTPRFILRTGQKWNQYIQTLDTFVKTVYEEIIDKEIMINQYLLLSLLYLYLTAKDKFTDKLKMIDKYVNKYDDKYFTNLFTQKVDGKIKKFYEGKKLESVIKLL